MKRKKAVVLLSGGLDSTTCMGIAQRDNYEIYAISFDYGQRHRIELDAAKNIAAFYEAKEHQIIKINNFGGSALTDVSVNFSEYEREQEGIPATYVPARNILFLSYALGYAEVVTAGVIYIGVSGADFSGYPDCRPQFIDAFQQVINVGTKTGVTGHPVLINTPLINLTKAQIIKLAIEDGTPLHLTVSCYCGLEKACGRCDSCKLRLQGFAGAGIKDPAVYVK